MMPWLVLGLGNSLAGADGFGPAVIARLREDPDVRRQPEIELVDAHTDILAHLDRFHLFDRVLLVDTVLADEPGIHTVEEETFGRWDTRMAGAHQLSPVAGVRLFRLLHPSAGTRISLVARFVREADFTRRPPPCDVLAGAEAVRALLRPVREISFAGRIGKGDLSWTY